MKISKIAVVALFAAGFLTVSATPGMATSSAVGYTIIELEDGNYSCEAEPEVKVEDLKPIDSCWTTEDGTDVCARGAIAPMPANVEDTPVDSSECSSTTDDQGVSSEVCMKAVPFSGTPEEDGGVGYVDDAPVDRELMFQSGVAETLESPADPTVSIAVAIFGVLAGALLALVIVKNRRKEAK
jgi:hypothetical protein